MDMQKLGVFEALKKDHRTQLDNVKRLSEGWRSLAAVSVGSIDERLWNS
jgi:hypothetical protein